MIIKKKQMSKKPSIEAEVYLTISGLLGLDNHEDSIQVWVYLNMTNDL